MAKQTVALGTVANDGTGDTLRAGGDKINDNFDELYGMIDTDGTLAANSDAKIPTQKAVKTAIATAVTGLLDFKGSTDTSANPNYPAASKGDAYLVSVAGKIGGASGKSVDVGDVYVASADNAGGTEASVGTSWFVLEHNLAGVLPLTGGTLTGALHVPDDAYDATTWNASTEVPTKNAVRDKIEALAGGGFTAASTTEALTGTDSAKGVTPDALAALWEQGADVASAGTTSLGEGGYFNITGTTTITDIDFATDKAGRTAWVKFAGALTLTHNASTLILPTGANITTAAGDTACFVSEGSDVVRCVAYNRASGAPLVSTGTSLSRLYSDFSPAGTPASNVETTLATYTLPAGQLASDGQAVRVTAWGTFAATTRSRTVTVYFGATANPTYSSTSSSVVQWRSEVLVGRVGATSQTGTAHSGAGIAGGNEDPVSRSRAFTPAETLSGTVEIKVTGTVGGSAVANDIICTGFLVEFLP